MFAGLREIGGKVQRCWHALQRPPVDWSKVKTLEIKMLVAPSSVAQALNELHAEKTKLIRARKHKAKKVRRKARR